jgi:ubiquinone/menaquinone biosynthesis C-methylase UbiE/glycosyltransferase involved in cell wall biosynthesis
MTKILHLAAHVGGGVGKALSGLAVESASVCPEISHSFVFFEPQEKPQFLELITGSGCEVSVAPQPSELKRLIEQADIVQLEFWNHPLTIQALCCNDLPAMRLLVWCHSSGLYNPVIPAGLFSAAERFLFTSSCSYESERVINLPADVRNRLGVVSSSGGFEGLPWPTDSPGELSMGYFGSLNFAKLHPRYVDFLAAVDTPSLTVRLIGDLTNREILERQAVLAGREGMFEFRGYTSNIAAELKAINVLAYLLNPEHYGTTENALLEAMAVGIVPIVLDNPAERLIIEDHRTGLIVNTPSEFANAVNWLHRNPLERQKIGRQAAETIRSKFAVSKMVSSLNDNYKQSLLRNKQEIDFSSIFGAEPADWFLSCQNDHTYFSSTNAVRPNPESFSFHALYEESKGTVFHFQKYFPDDFKLNTWANELTLQKSSKHCLPMLACPCCQFEDSEELLKLNCGNIDGSTLYSTLKLRVCLRCGHAYNDLAPEEISGLEEYYNIEYAPANLNSVVTGGDRPGSADLLTIGRYDNLFRMLSAHVSHDDNILDVGCALGGFLDYLRQKGFTKLFGVDSTPTYVHHAKESMQFTIKFGNAEKLPFTENMFKVAVIEQVLEHLVHPAKAFREAFRVLKDGGLFCIGVPDASRYAEYNFFDFYWVLLREHIQHFDIENLSLLAKREGFELVEYIRNDHAIMSSKMIMPNLCALFRKCDSSPTKKYQEIPTKALHELLKNYAKQESSRLEDKQRVFKILAEGNRPVYVWGIGREFLYLYEAAGLKKCNIAGLIDMNPSRQGSSIDGICVGSPDQLCKAGPNATVLITAFAHTDSIRMSLKDYGFSGDILVLA